MIKLALTFLEGGINLLPTSAKAVEKSDPPISHLPALPPRRDRLQRVRKISTFVGHNLELDSSSKKL